MPIKTSINIDQQTKAALDYLRSLPGGWNLTGEIKRIVVRIAKERGWK